MTERVIVVGGGAVGLSLAWELSRRDTRVTLIERGQVGKATSWSASGILPAANFSNATDPIDQLRGLSHELFPAWAEQLGEIASIDVGLRRCGGWYLADTPGERAVMAAMVGYWDELGIECDPVSTKSLASREPALAPWAQRSDSAAAWWVPDESQIRPPRYLQALRLACRVGGVEILESAAVVDIRDEPTAAVLANDAWYQADAVVVCGGAWTGKVAAMLQLEQAIVPVRGQMLLLKTEKPAVRGVVNVGHRYVVCREDGYTLVGSCEEEVGFELGTDDAMLDSLFQFAVTFVPQLELARRVDAWSGLRPMTFDGFPMIGRVPGHENLYVAAGHFRSGLHLSPGTAVTLADTMLGSSAKMNLDAFRVGKQPVQPEAANRS